MSYGLLTGLYFSESSNADLTSSSARAKLHIRTPLEDMVARSVAVGLDVVLTGNPGDGKSHLVRVLQERGALGNAVVEPDLSARATDEVVSAWAQTRASGRPFVLCGNEGPLNTLLEAMAREPALAAARLEISGQLGRLLAYRPEDLPAPPTRALLVDLADRNVLDEVIVEAALSRVASEEFLPDLPEAHETSAGRNLSLLRQSEICRRRLAGALVAAGRRAGGHITFRQLWGAVAFALTRARAPSALRTEVAEDKVGIDSLPLANLVDRHGRGPLLSAAQRFGDPAHVTDPELDEQIWASGQPSSGGWLIEDVVAVQEVPARLWEDPKKRDQALALHARLKRMVAFLHERGQVLIDGLADDRAVLNSLEDEKLLRTIAAGVRALYLTAHEETAAPDWLREGIPLWVGLSYEDKRPAEWPHVALSARRLSEFRILRAHRAPWLNDALGGSPEVVLFSHEPSKVALRVDTEIFAALQRATATSGPTHLPEPVHRFMARLSGWEEQMEPLVIGEERAVFLRHPRGRVAATASVRGTSYVG
jgi:hypothetical protein